MLHLQRPAVALACVTLCLAQLLMTLLILVQEGRWSRTMTWRWQMFDVMLIVALLLLLLLRLPRDLQWRPRRSKRTSREVLVERQRIARDLHDHVGAQLVATMAQIDARNPAMQPVLGALEQCLLELRLVVDSMDGDDDILPGRLARLRGRLQPALDRQGIAVQWRVALAPEFAWPSGDAAREFAAIVQEAVSNVLQHSGASELLVALEPEPAAGPGAWRLRVCDNGRGLGAGQEGGGQGLASMRRRAERLGAQLELLPADGGGLCVQVTVAAQAVASTAQGR